MLERAAKLMPVASVAALVVLAVFNLGYFWPIGLHFLGLVDLANLVYALGLSASSILVVSTVALQVSERLKNDLPVHKLKLRLSRVKWLVTIGVVMVVSSAIMLAVINVPLGYCANLFFYGAVILGIGWAFKMGLSRQLDGTTETGDIVILCMAGLAAAFGAGLFKADVELSSKTVYRIALKADTLDGVQILRSSSNGFIIAKDRVVSFIPQSEVARVTALAPSK